ncbi:hypothetical protein SOVF_098950 [Spinacia oleracea]|uniref:11S globulin seed storage protein 2 n=1 Tax=Spinacia oleracea TaxID=3562 RepID=A0A9R0J373_SPIOL|nr:11S globulin seed storage protein 2-like [Spinacia oleracea]KNA15343.1 hypothetical protein SOVF_098950 [Spinacia oleracea]
MENMSLVPLELPQKLVDGEGGSYYAWNDTVFPFLGAGQVSGGLLIMKPGGFAIPHYADCSKIGYVVQGTDGAAGMIYPESTEEKVVKLKKGDAIVVPSGTVSWWFNAGHDELKIIFLGETQNATIPGTFTYGLLAGAIGILKGFSSETISKAYDISNEQANKLVNTQKEALMFKLVDEGITMPKPSSNTQHLTFEFDKNAPNVHVEKGGYINFLTGEKHSPLEGIKLSGKLLKLEPNATLGPTYYAKDSGIELTYVIKGSGSVRVVGLNGQVVLDTKLEAGQLFVVPKFHVAAIDADNEGIECFSIVTTSKPILAHVAGKMSPWKALSPQVLQVSLNVSSEFSELFMDKIHTTTIIMPPN